MLTSSPYKNEFVDPEESGRQKNSRKSKKATTKYGIKSKTMSKYFIDDSEADNDDDDDDDDDDNDDDRSLYHKVWYSKPTEGRITCSRYH
jgi:hypothetical protein